MSERRAWYALRRTLPSWRFDDLLKELIEVCPEYCINEGGGFGIKIGERVLYFCQTAEKGVCWLRARTHGKPGHASTPAGRTAVDDLTEALSRLSRARLPQHRTRTVEALIRYIAQNLGGWQGRLFPLALNPWIESFILKRLESAGTMAHMAPVLRAMLHNTATATVLRAGQKTNVIPSLAEAEIDCRILPGQTPESLLAELRPILGDEVELEPIVTSTPYESDHQSELYDVISQVMAEHDPGCSVVPFLVPGSTDGRFLAAKGVRVYGFGPMKYEPDMPFIMELAHGHNERISVANLMFGTRVLYDVVRRFCT